MRAIDLAEDIACAVIAAADASPIHYLALIEQIELLGDLYREVLVPETVARELQHPRTPAPVADWIACPPARLRVEAAQGPVDAALDELDPGERDAIRLALAHGVQAVLIDEAEGRRGFFNAYREGKRVTKRTLTEIADRFQYWLKNRSEKWALRFSNLRMATMTRAGETSSWNRISRTPNPNQVVAILKAREPARILVAIRDLWSESRHPPHNRTTGSLSTAKPAPKLLEPSEAAFHPISGNTKPICQQRNFQAPPTVRPTGFLPTIQLCGKAGSFGGG